MEATINGSVQVELSGMAMAEDDFAQVLYAVEAELDRLDADLRASLREWTGEASQAYAEAHAQWRAAAADMLQALAALRRVIGTAHQNYRATLSANLGMWRGNR